MIPHSPFLNPQWPWSVVRSPVLRSQWSLVTNCAYNATSPFTGSFRNPKSTMEKVHFVNNVPHY